MSGCTSDTTPPPRKAATRWTLPGGGGGAASDHPLGLKWNWSQQATLLYAERNAGGATFFETEWCDIEPREGKLDWDRVDEVVHAAERLGYELMLKIRVGQCWATGAPPSATEALDPYENRRKTPSQMPRDLDAYADFVRAFVERYSAEGVHVYALENEVDTANFWAGSAEDYGRLFRIGAAAVRAADASATVLDGGVSSTAYGVAIAAALLEEGRVQEALDFYAAYYARRQAGDASRFRRAATAEELRKVVDSPAGSRASNAFDVTFELAREGVVDAYQLHFYEPWQLAGEVLEWVRRSVPASVPVEAWEIGVAWPGRGYSEQDHAVETGKLIATLMAGGVRRLVYLPLAFTPGGNSRPIFRGLLRPDGSELPAAAVYRVFVRASQDSSGAHPVEVEGLSGVLVDRGTSTVAVVWAARGDLHLRGAALSSDIVDAMGTPLPWLREGLEIGSRPVLITVDSPWRTTRGALGAATVG